MIQLDSKDFCSIISANLDISLSFIVKKKRANAPSITFEELLLAILAGETLPSTASILGISIRSLNRLIDEVFGDSLVRCASKTWRARLLEFCDYRKCSDCKLILPNTEFYRSNNNIDIWSDYKNICKSCDKNRTRDRYKNRPHLHRASNARYKAAKLKAIPKWADLESISKIYENCPEGFEVDHIIPLQGENVCGLHLETNLQYLTPTENRVKSNKF